LWGIPIYTVGFVLLYVAAILTLWSMALYIKAAWPSLLGKRQVSGSLESNNISSVEIDGSTGQVND
ncbi:MAG: hypothetical protein N0C84_18105, partial [Candidatus Thiodiazotropha taylori]|nr:hypothetical protein [Candidatus Thiodiazotropha taylori]MCW4258382.1 hypothetical protein [Candidatus Thiodiazotropha taylori]